MNGTADCGRHGRFYCTHKNTTDNATTLPGVDNGLGLSVLFRVVVYL